jgi:hypothetical protein
MAVVEGRYKLVLRFGSKGDKLYNLKDDPAEMRPLPDRGQDKDRARLLHFALDHLRDTREQRDTVLALRSRIREIRQDFALNSARSEASENRNIVEIGEHG